MDSTLLELSPRDNEAIKHFRHAIEKESHGLMSDAIEYYRKAFKLNDKVDKLYRQTDVPEAINKLHEERGKNILKRVDDSIVKKIKVDELLASFAHIEAVAPGPDDIEQDLTIKISKLNVDGDAVDETVNLKPVSILTKLPNDVWLTILESLLLRSPESWFNMSITCKKFAHLGFGSSDIWRQLCYLIYPKQIYYENQFCLNEKELPIPRDPLDILPQYNDSWKNMVNNRPFIKFLGCYISVINYYSEGGKAEFSSAWTNPIRVITYYRYLRFYPDGSCVTVLTTEEPPAVIPHLLKHKSPEEIVIARGENYKSYHGRWTVSASGEVEIIVHQGSVPYYTFYYIYNITSLGGVFRHNKLSWKKYFGVRKKMSDDDDREGEVSEFALRNEKAFKFLRVRSYTYDN